MRSTLLVLALAARASGVGAAAPPQVPAAEPHDVFVEIAGARIHALCVGARPDVLLLHGEGSAEEWRPVLARLDDSIGACAYDRRGSGESSPAPGKRGWYELLDELRRVHEALGARPPYVLAAQSTGGLYARLFALDRPTDVRGLVLVDPAHEDLAPKVRHAMPRDEWDRWDQARSRPNRDGVVQKQIEDRLRGRRLPDMPVTVLASSSHHDGPGWDDRFLDEAARQLHESILQGITLARHIPAGHGGSHPLRDDARLVAAEILRVVRSRGP